MKGKVLLAILIHTIYTPIPACILRVAQWIKNIQWSIMFSVYLSQCRMSVKINYIQGG